MMTLQWKKCAVLLGMAAVLAGCATHRVVEGDVRSFSRLPAAATAQQPMTYRLERLPSQQTPSFDPSWRWPSKPWRAPGCSATTTAASGWCNWARRRASPRAATV